MKRSTNVLHVTTKRSSPQRLSDTLNLNIFHIEYHYDVFNVNQFLVQTAIKEALYDVTWIVRASRYIYDAGLSFDPELSNQTEFGEVLALC